MHLHIIESIDQIDSQEWNTLAGEDHPFLRHEFLAALEHTGCVGGRSGWTPHYLIAEDSAGRLAGAVPLYVKTHSYGEYVFDWAWAGAYARAGLDYYPKLVAAVPFTPATGPRLLIAAGQDAASIAVQLIEGVQQQVRELAASSIHWLFATERDGGWLQRHGYLRRVGCQFHWRNRGYRDFDGFLAGLSSEKRKKIKRERRYVREAGIEMEIITGAALQETHWQAFYRFYRSTIEKHGAQAYLTRAFFHELGARMPQQVVLILARHGREYVAGALNLRGRDGLYGRYWGTLEAFHSLHFETCYYRALEYCIEQGLSRFEAGAQGEHKLSRGFLPTPVYSYHWLSRPEYFNAVADFIARERAGVEGYMDELREHAPFKNIS